MRHLKIFLLSGLCALFFTVSANAQELINQATEFYNKGVEAVSAQNWATALNQFTQALAIAEKLEDEGADMTSTIKGLIPSLHLYLGQELAQASKVDEAITALEQAMAAARLYNDPGATEKSAKDLIDQLNMRVAGDLLNNKKYDEAITAYKKVLEADPDNGAVYMYLGAAYAGLANEGEAIAAYTKAIELGNKDAAPRLANIYLIAANTALRGQKWNDTYSLVQKAIALVPDNAAAVKMMGIAALNLKKYSEATPALEKTLAANPNASDKNTTIYRLAQSLEGQGKNSQACGYYKQLLNDANYKQMAEHKIKNVLKCE